MTGPIRPDPSTARLDLGGYPVRARFRERSAIREPHTGSRHPHHLDEAALRLGLRLLHLDRTPRKHARRLARLGLALEWQWQGRHVHSTMLYIELPSVIDGVDRETRALTGLCAAANDADQRLQDAARTGYRAARQMQGHAA